MAERVRPARVAPMQPPMQAIMDKLRRAYRRGEELRLPAPLVAQLAATPTIMTELARLESLEARRTACRPRLVPASPPPGSAASPSGIGPTATTGASSGETADAHDAVQQGLAVARQTIRRARRAKP